MEIGSQLVSRIPDIVIILLSITGAIAAFWLTLSKLRGNNSLPAIFHILISVVISILTFFIVFNLLAILCYITIGTWCEGCQEFH